jgi:hypothetical protein
MARVLFQRLEESFHSPLETFEVRQKWQLQTVDRVGSLFCEELVFIESRSDVPNRLQEKCQADPVLQKPPRENWLSNSLFFGNEPLPNQKKNP